MNGLSKNNGFADDLVDPLLGGAIGASAARLRHRAQAEIEQDIADYAEIAGDVAVYADQRCPVPDAVVQMAAADLSAVAGAAQADREASQQALQNATKAEQVFRLQHGIIRDVMQPDVALNLAMLGFMVVVEGIIAALFLFRAGFVSGFGEAAALGLSISGANILLAAGLGGYAFGRYWNYGLHARYPDGQMRMKRWMGRIGAVSTALAIVLLLGVSGIVRATEEPEHLRFTAETFLAAASNFESLMLWMISGAFAILAWVKGLRAFADPYPGLAEASAVSHGLRDASVERLETAFDTLRSIYDDADDDLAEMVEDVAAAKADLADDLSEARQLKASVLSKVAQVQSDLSAAAMEQANIAQIITGKPAAAHADTTMLLDADAIQARLPDVQPPPGDPFAGFEDYLTQARAVLSEAYRAALDQINGPPDAQTSSLNPQGASHAT